MTNKTLREGADSVEAVTSRTAAENQSQSQDEQHSPLPWSIAPHPRSHEPADVIDADGEFVANCGCTCWAIPNAERIVRCVNSHDDLLAALKWAMRHLRGHVSFGSNGDAFARVSGDELVGFVPKWDKAEAAIAKAEGR